MASVPDASDMTSTAQVLAAMSTHSTRAPFNPPLVDPFIVMVTDVAAV